MSIASLISRICGCGTAGDLGREFKGSRVVPVVLATAWLAGCTPQVQDIGPSVVMPEVSDQIIVVSDGHRLPVRAWHASGKETHVILALHGFNDYSNFFDDPGDFLKFRGIASYAYDQRGFGAIAQHQAQRIEQDGLARPRFPGEHAETAPEIEIERLDQHHIADGELSQHSSMQDNVRHAPRHRRKCGLPFRDVHKYAVRQQSRRFAPAYWASATAVLGACSCTSENAFWYHSLPG